MILDIRKNLTKFKKKNFSKKTAKKNLNEVVSYLTLENAVRKMSVEVK